MDNINYIDLYEKFYLLIDKMILLIHDNKISEYMNYCNYISLNKNEQYYYPLTICLGGSGFIQYNQIFIKEKLINDAKINSMDYDISFSLKQITQSNINIIIQEINNIYDKLISKFKYEHLNINNFELTKVVNNQRIHFRINCNPYNELTKKLTKNQQKQTIHIAEFSFWLNGKISDNFTINDFEYNSLYLYKNNNVHYYLLPLDLLVKTLLYAIVDFFERRNFNKCIKYLERIKFIKDCNKSYLNSDKKNIYLSIIFDSYKNQIKRKYKMIHDYPFLIAYELKDIKNSGIIKCIYRKLRKHNKKYIKKEIEKYKEECKDKQDYKKEFSEITIEDTDEE